MRTNTLEEMGKIAKKRNGHCISKIYKNTHSKLKWKCKNGHIWENTPSNIKRGQWCRKCATEMNSKLLRLDIKEMKNIARSHGGKCLSTKYVNAHTKLKWRCSKGHVWLAAPVTIKYRDSWCPECSGRKVLTIEDMKTYAKKEGGKCLSSNYQNAHQKLKWQCSKGHKWEAIWNSIQRGTWCPICSRQSIRTIQDMEALAAKKGGKCLSKEYKGHRNKLTWQCDQAHKWECTPNRIKKGSWCPKCAVARNSEKLRGISRNTGKKITIKYLHKLAEQMNGQCLSKSYVDAKTKYLWKCDSGHIWKGRIDHVRNGHWCKKCGHVNRGLKRRCSIDEMKIIAQERKGECLSDEYKGDSKKLTWRCYYGHCWEAVPSTIKQGSWCPICSSGMSERMCRVYFEHIFEAPFPKRRPEWLRTKAGTQLELDGYNKDLKLAFEHHGRQHYEYTRMFHKTKRDFVSQKKRDKCKAEICRKRNIRLIVIPELFYKLKIHDLLSFIQKELLKYRISYNKKRLSMKIDLSPAYNTDGEKRINELQDIARARKGKCVSTVFFGNRSKAQMAMH